VKGSLKNVGPERRVIMDEALLDNIKAKIGNSHRESPRQLRKVPVINRSGGIPMFLMLSRIPFRGLQSSKTPALKKCSIL
jgi:hypothetical protein